MSSTSFEPNDIPNFDREQLYDKKYCKASQAQRFLCNSETIENTSEVRCLRHGIREASLLLTHQGSAILLREKAERLAPLGKAVAVVIGGPHLTLGNNRHRLIYFHFIGWIIACR